MSSFIAQLKLISSKALVSGDNSHRVVLETADPSVTDLGKIPATQLVVVTIEEAKE